MCVVFVSAIGVPQAYASTYTRNLILSDGNMRATYSMTQSDIQSFLKAQPGVLKSLVTTDHAGVSEPASAIIYQACQNFRISPRVMLALLQKEQSLLTRTTLATNTLSRAIGAGCPDGSTNYYPGFGKQMWYGAWLLSNFGEVTGVFPSTFVALWSPGMTRPCEDSQTVIPANLATYKLYVYNPSISGNSTFWTVYAKYFGDPLAAFAPAKVSLSAAAVGYASAKLNWTGVTGATGYEIGRATSSGGTYSRIATTTVTSSTDATLTTGKTYYYKVRAYHTEGATTTYGSYSDVKSANPTLGKVSLSAASASYTSIRLSWGNVSGASGYEIYRATSKSGTYAKVSAITGTSYTNTGRTTGRTYYYKVRAYRSIGSTKAYGSYSDVKSTKAVPAKVSGLTLAKASSSSIGVKWSSVSGATAYEIYRASSATGSFSRIRITSATSYKNTGLTRGRTYRYKVRAYHTEGRTKVYGSYSTTAGMPL